MNREELTVRLGQRLKRLRLQRNLSLDDVAGLTEVSKPMLGQIERGVSNPTVATLWKIASGLKVPFTAFVADEPEVQLLRSVEQNVFYEDENRFQVHSTFAVTGVPVELFRVQLLPGCRREAEAHATGVRESLTVTQGAMIVVVDGVEYALAEGDAFHFAADISHSYENRSQASSWMQLAIIYP